MGGANCSVAGCTVARQLNGPSIFKVTTGKDEFNTKWREKLVHIIIKDRTIDKDLAIQIENNTLHICERHFEETDINRGTSFPVIQPHSE